MCCNHHMHKQLNIQLQEYTEVPGDLIWWNRMQEKLSAAGAPPRTPLGELTLLPDPLAGGEGEWLPPLQLPPAVGPLDLATPVPPLQNCAPLDSGSRRP